MTDLQQKRRTPVYPVQCECGHIYLERYTFSEPTEEGVHGFCWCGWCRTRVNVMAHQSWMDDDDDT